jgi:hypothetical protein
MAGTENGALLARASEEFDVFVTVDRNLRHQQNLSKFRLAVIVLLTRNNNYEELQHFTPKILAALTTISVGDLVILEA